MINGTISFRKNNCINRILISAAKPAACSRFDFYPYPKDVQQRMYFEFGSKEIDARQAKTILRRYPFVHITLHKGYGHCQYMAAEKKAYLAMLEARMKQKV